MKAKYYKTIRRYILISMILVPLVPFVLILAIGHYYFTASIETSTLATLNRIVEDHRQMIDTFLQERKQDLAFVLYAHPFSQLKTPDHLKKVFALLQDKSPAFVDLGLFDPRGTHVAYQGPYELKWRNYRNAHWFKAVMQRGYYISDVFLGYRQVPHFVIALARNQDGMRWAIRATIDTAMFNELVEKVRIGTSGEAYLLNSNGVLQTNRRSGGDLMETLDEPLEYPKGERRIATFISKDSQGREFLSATTWLRNKQWLLVVRQDLKDAFKALHAAVYLIGLIMIGGGAVITVIAVIITNQIVFRMEQMDSEKEVLGQQLIRAHRLAELGQMAAGFAHEINNPLQIIKSEQALIEMIFFELKTGGKLADSEELKELEDSMEQIKLQIERCAGITQAILKFGRQSEPAIKDLDLKRFIPEVVAMIEKKASVHGITVKKALGPETPLVHGDPGQLQQVLLNLFNNAIDAIIERHGADGGKLTILTGVNGEQGQAEIQVKDNGTGIGPEELKKIFSPFFTTKPVGKGTGLGLSVCYGIIEGMGGTMAVESQKGAGTTFTIRLPRH